MTLETKAQARQARKTIEVTPVVFVARVSDVRRKGSASRQEAPIYVAGPSNMPVAHSNHHNVWFFEDHNGVDPTRCTAFFNLAFRSPSALLYAKAIILFAVFHKSLSPPGSPVFVLLKSVAQ